jgi:hypothetical protein
MGRFSADSDFVTLGRSINPASDVTLVDEALYIGVTGDVEVVPSGQDTSITFVAVPAGTFLPVVCTELKSAGTTATSILALK